jgi:hypothetical protein
MLFVLIVRYSHRCCSVGGQTQLVLAADGDRVDSATARSQALGTQIDVMSIHDYPGSDS